jgi:hypothetical protein
MAYFFEAWMGMTKAQADVAANSGLSTLPVDPIGNGTFGLWGVGIGGNPLKIRVRRGATVVSDGGPKALVKLTSLLDAATASKRGSMAPERTRIFLASGLKPGDEIDAVNTDGGHRAAGPLTVTLVSGTAGDVMQDWANQLRADPAYKPSQQFLCPIATPYLALRLGNMTPTRLNEALVGGPTSAVHGLAIHCTAGATRDVWGTAINGCVNTWNHNYETNNFVAAAHFAISAEGTIVQFIPTNRIAWAQGTPGDRNWISVEVENDGSKPMLAAQVEATRRLFGWVCATYPVPRRLAMGTLFAKKNDVKYKKDLDAATTAACDAAGTPTTTRPFEATFARGLSCHLWLDARNSKPCPGVGIIGQMYEIAKP